MHVTVEGTASEGILIKPTLMMGMFTWITFYDPIALLYLLGYVLTVIIILNLPALKFGWTITNITK
jgi:hypothetical protein